MTKDKNEAAERCIRQEADQEQIGRCRAELSARQSEWSFLSKVFALAGSEARLKILYLLHAEKELCPCDLADILRMSIPSVSQHLRKLRDGGLIWSRRQGKTIYYNLEAEQEAFLTALYVELETSSTKTLEA